MKSDLYETWYNAIGGIKEAPQKIWDWYMHASAQNLGQKTNPHISGKLS